MAHAVCLSRYFSRPHLTLYSFQVRQCFTMRMPLTRLQRSSVYSSDLLQPLLKTKHVKGARKLPLAWPQRFCSSLSHEDSLDEKSPISEEKRPPNRTTLDPDSLNLRTSESRLKDHFLKEDSTPPSQRRKGERKIFISNFPGELSVKDIKSHFSQFGPVISVTIPWDDKTKKRMDFGFVLFSSVDSTLKALESNSHNIKGSIIKASTPTYVSKRRLFLRGQILVSGLPDDITLEDVKDYFEGFAQVCTIDIVFPSNTGVNKNFAYISFDDKNVSKNILRHKHSINNQEVFVQHTSSSSRQSPLVREKKVFVEGIPLEKSEKDIHYFFNQFGDIRRVVLTDNLAKHGTQSVIISFKKKESVDYVISQPQVDMNGCMLTVRRLAYTSPSYLEFLKTHRKNPTHAKDQPSDFDLEAEHNILDGYPDLK